MLFNFALTDPASKRFRQKRTGFSPSDNKEKPAMPLLTSLAFIFLQK